jgi:hypothetical protein
MDMKGEKRPRRTIVVAAFHVDRGVSASQLIEFTDNGNTTQLRTIRRGIRFTTRQPNAIDMTTYADVAVAWDKGGTDLATQRVLVGISRATPPGRDARIGDRAGCLRYLDVRRRGRAARCGRECLYSFADAMMVA